MITDPQRAAELGAKTQADIERLHIGASWTEQLERLYALTAIPALAEVPDIGDTPHMGPPDTTIAMASPPLVDVDDLLVYHMRLLPLRARVSSWLLAMRKDRRTSPTLLLSESAAARLQRLRTSVAGRVRR